MIITLAYPFAPERQALLSRCLEGLEERARLIVRKFYGEGASRAQIATTLGMQEAGIKTRLQRIRRSLRGCIEQQLEAKAEQ